jgi:BirA family biotin operon repressor/biotin-[acetyl-CoA-carboxylase] ligase
MSDPLPPDLAAALAAADARLGPFGRLYYFSEVDSTNDVALALAAAGAPEGTSVVADLQRAGRGRRGRSWFSPPGAGLYLSVIVGAAQRAGPLSLVTLGAGVAAADAVAAVTGLPVELKWPNDLVIGRPWRKLAGVLCESVGLGARVDAVVVGIGINLRTAAYPREIADRATSVETELGRPVDRAPIVIECLTRLQGAVDTLRDGRGETICQAWRRLGRAGFEQASVRWHDEGRERRGMARDIDNAGALVVECEGQMERLIAGEVTWDRLSHD